MSDRKLADADVKIHDRAVKALGLETALVMLEVARDLRSGLIEAKKYDQCNYGGYNEERHWDCNTPCCIWGHVCERMGIKDHNDRVGLAVKVAGRDNALNHLFGSRSAVPIEAANAIENYVIKGYNFPWFEIDRPLCRGIYR